MHAQFQDFATEAREVFEMVGVIEWLLLELVMLSLKTFNLSQEGFVLGVEIHERL